MGKTKGKELLNSITLVEYHAHLVADGVVNHNCDDDGVNEYNE